MGMRIKEELSVCSDCLIMVANNDPSGIDERDYKRVTSAVRALGPHAVADGEDLGFSWRDCECCQGLAGERYKVAILEPIQS
jgi:hypothetical protein